MKRSLIFIVTLVLSFNCFAYCVDCKCEDTDCGTLQSLGTWEEQLEGLRVNMMIDPRTRGKKLTIGDKEYSCVLNSDDSIDCYER